MYAYALLLMISLIFPPTQAGKVNYHMELATLNGTVGNNISIPCNIELGVNTAQTNYRVTITRRVFYNDESNQLSLIMNYRNNMDPKILSVNNTATDPTSYQFYSSNLTLYVENFSVPSPQDVLGVKFTCRFYVVIQGMATTTATKTAVIFGFRKFITRYNIMHVEVSSVACFP